MFASLKTFFSKPDAADVVKRELQEATVSLLQNQSLRDYYIAQCAFDEARVARLRRYDEGQTIGEDASKVFIDRLMSAIENGGPNVGVRVVQTQGRTH